MKNYLAFDLGASSGRAVLGKWAGRRLTLDEIHRFENRPLRMPGLLHWNVVGLFEEIVAALRQCAASGVRLDGVSVDSWGVDFGLLGDDDRLLGPPVHYRDPRTEGIRERTFEIVPRETIFERTGIQFLPFNTLYQLMAMKFADSGQLKHATTLVMIADLFAKMLCGRTFGEFTLASTTQCYDPREGGWSKTLFDDLGLPLEIMPEVVEPATVAGELSVETIAEVGLKGVPVIAGASHDTACAVAAVPARGDDWVYISSGTWSLMGMELDEPLIDVGVLEAGFTNEGGVGGTFRFLKNISGLWLVQECRRRWAAEGDVLSYDALTRMAAEGEPFRSVIDPDDPAFLNPDDMPQAIRDYCRRTGQAVPDRREDVLRAALEGLALKYREVLERLRRVTGKDPRTLHIVGGGVRNELLSRFAADACGLPVLAGPVEATAVGNILTQMMATGEISDLDAARDVVRESFPTKTCEPRDTATWDEAYARYSRLLSSAAE